MSDAMTVEDGVPEDKSQKDLDNMFILDDTGDLAPEDNSNNDQTNSAYDTLNKNNHTDGNELQFNVDTAGELQSTDTVDGDVNMTERVPSYHTEFTGFLTDPEYNIDTGKRVYNDAKPKKTCFNCLGDHSLGSCKIKFNMRRVAENKRKILGAKMVSNVRYHEDPDNKYNYIKPGCISKELKLALGLQKKQLPEHIYRMRILGYPPGWLREAEVHRSDVALIGTDGKPIDHPEDEEGEVSNLVKYKPDKLVKFPGFNCQVEKKKYIDEWEYYRSCPMQDHHHIEEFRRYMNVNKSQGYKRKRLKVNEDSTLDPNDTTSHTISEMDVSIGDNDDSIIEISRKDTVILKQDSSPPSIEEGELSDDSNKSASLVEESSSSSNNKVATKENTPDSRETEHEENQLLDKQHKLGKSTNLHLGTHIPDSISVCKKLPDPNLWTVDVHDHILFENLSDSTGTWDQMKGIMQRVKTKMKSIHS